MDINQFKFIINSGCSYGYMGDSIKHMLIPGNPYKFKTNSERRLRDSIGSDIWFEADGNVVIVDVSLSSQSSEYIADSTIEVISFLLKNNVKSENIYSFVEWTQWGRITLHPPTYLNTNINFVESKIDNISSIGYHYKRDFLYELFKKLKISYNNNIASIHNRIYLNPTHTTPPSAEFEFYYNTILDYEILIPIEVKIKNYIDNILRTQYFLKENNILYNYCFMQGSMVGWYESNTGLQHSLETLNHSIYSIDNNKLVKNINHISVNDPNTHVENVCDFIKKDYEKLDTSNIWFYNSENYIRGGYDEWAIDTMGLSSMISTQSVARYLNGETLNVNDVVLDFQRHPNENLYKLLWNDIATNCKFLRIKNKFNSELLKMYNEDINSTNSTENGITLSNKFIQYNFT